MSVTLPTIEQRFIPGDTLGIEVRQEGPEQPKTLSWYAAHFDVLSEDLGGFRERIGKRAFSKTLESDDVRALINHDPNMILGRTSAKTLKLHVDLTGLHANTRLPDTSYARDLLVNVENGNITGGSFMFSTVRDTWTMEDLDGVETVIRTVNEVRLYDVSPVTFPAYPQTEGSASVRSLAEEWRAKLTGKKPETREAGMVCSMMKAMCAACEMECEMKEEMGKRELPLLLGNYRRRLELLCARGGK